MNNFPRLAPLTRGCAAMGGCATTLAFGRRIIAARGGGGGGWRDIGELNNKEHWSRLNNVFDWSTLVVG